MISIEVQTPPIKEILSNYEQFQIMRKPPPASLMEFFGYLNFQKPHPESLSVSKITTKQFTHFLNELREAIIKEVRSKENEISYLEALFGSNPPIFLENFNQFSESDKNNLIHYFQMYTELYRSSATLWINKQIFNLEHSYSRADIKSGTQKLQEINQTILSVKDVRLEKYSKFMKLQEQLQNSKVSNNQIDFRNKFINLKTNLSFSVTQIKQGKGTIKLADYLINQNPFTPKNHYEAHCIIVSSYRCKEFEYEVNEISKFFPFVKMNGINLFITVVRDENPELRFDVIFPIQTSYPWCIIDAKVNVLIGDANKIESEIHDICNNVLFVRRPILEICTKIAQTFLKS